MIQGSLGCHSSLPMHEDGTLDLDAYRAPDRWHIAPKETHGIVAVGTNGESPTVDFDEHNELFAPRWSGTQTGAGGDRRHCVNSTAEAISS